MNKLDKQYTDLLQDILDNGITKSDRTGTGTLSVFGRQIRHKMSDGFPLLTTKKMHFKSIVTELLWFLRGDTNIKYLVDNDCHIWDGDAYKNYTKEVNKIIDGYMCGDILGMQPHIEMMFSNPDKLIPLTKDEFIKKIKGDKGFSKRSFVEKWGNLGPIYGRQWRQWSKNDCSYPKCICEDNEITYCQNKHESIDQIQTLINDLKTNPDSRRLMVSAWNPAEIEAAVLPPCHYGFQVWTRELSLEERCDLGHKYVKYNKWDMLLGGGKESDEELCDGYNIPTRTISLMWNQRSVDTFLGLPFNIASYGLLLEIIAEIVNMVPDELIGNLGDVHLYNNHIEQAKEQIGRRYTHEERFELLKQSMGEENYNELIKELVPFGGGMSEYYDIHKIPFKTRRPFELPKLIINGEFWLPGTDDGCGMGPGTYGDVDGLIKGFEIGDFQIENYKSHPAIKADLSN